ncbi:MAG: hypothetical protein CW691_11055 [Candidatus Bathyarchaeum sp.]|nr:MAG: hypothetical protein CW691_11055 [Candidatus Bathyarchaeum sp.]
MSQQRNIGYEIKYQLLMSAIGLVIVFVLTIYPPTAPEFAWRKPIIGSIFSTFCILGILAVFSPNQCRKIVNIKKQNTDHKIAKPVVHADPNVLQGHHPTCGKYSAHTFQVNGKTFCAACVGLLFGGLFALAGAVAYFFCGWNIFGNSSLIVLLGIVGVCIGLFQFKFKSQLRLMANTIFVLGALLLLIGVDKSVHNIFFDLFVISLIVFWLLIRISLSQLDHEIICSNCETENCMSRQ